MVSKGRLAIFLGGSFLPNDEADPASAEEDLWLLSLFLEITWTVEASRAPEEERGKNFFLNHILQLHV